MKLYYSKGACSLAVRILIHEMGVPAEFELVNLKTKQTDTGQDFLKINKKGAVPTLLLDDNSILTENAVIHQYLAEKFKATDLLPAQGDMRYHILEWLNYITTELHKGFSPFFNPAISKEIKETVFIPIIKKKFDYLNENLNGREFLMGDHYTLPEGYLFVMLLWAKNMGFELATWPNVERYFNDLQKRPSVKKSLEQEGIGE